MLVRRFRRHTNELLFRGRNRLRRILLQGFLGVMRWREVLHHPRGEEPTDRTTGTAKGNRSPRTTTRLGRSRERTVTERSEGTGARRLARFSHQAEPGKREREALDESTSHWMSTCSRAKEMLASNPQALEASVGVTPV